MTFIVIGKGVNIFFFLTNVAMWWVFFRLLEHDYMSAYMHKLDDGFWYYGWFDKLFTYDIYLVIYSMSCLAMSKIYGILGGLLISGLVIVEVMFS